MRALKFVLPLLLLGSGLAACESDSRSGYTQGTGYPPGYYAYEPSRACDTYPQGYSNNDWLNHKSNSAYWDQRNAGC
jgi:hypothetical protein